jgi:hypothetical protein
LLKIVLIDCSFSVSLIPPGAHQVKVRQESASADEDERFSGKKNNARRTSRKSEKEGCEYSQCSI